VCQTKQRTIIIGERIRDKMAAAKRKGKYTGGTPPLNVGWEQKSRRAPEPAISCLRGVEVFDRKCFHLGAASETIVASFGTKLRQ